MPDNVCQCGCGGELPAGNKSGFKWGHKGKTCAPAPAAEPEDAAPETEPDEPQPDVVTFTFSEHYLDRLWRGFTFAEKSAAISAALDS